LEANGYFTDFLSNIRLDDDTRRACRDAHRDIRRLLAADERLAPAIVATFLQGSYRRSTIIRPEETQLADVDVIVVTRLDEADYPVPESAMNEFLPFLDEHYAGSYQLQGRSIGITTGGVSLDLVITSAPSEAESEILAEADKQMALEEDEYEADGIFRFKAYLSEARKAKPAWQLEPLRIPDRDAACWKPTHPLAQIEWTADKNRVCNYCFLKVVRAVKWWRRRQDLPKHPKGYPLEHMIGAVCPDGIESVALGVTLALEAATETFGPFVLSGTVPFLADHGVAEHNVLGRISADDFAAFVQAVQSAARTARSALDSQDLVESIGLWRQLFGEEFPEATGGGPGGFAAPSGPASPSRGGRFA